MATEAICTGCGVSSSATGEYGPDDPVEDDGTYAAGKFVCTRCYVRLIRLRLDVGPAKVIQDRAARLTRGTLCEE